MSHWSHIVEPLRRAMSHASPRTARWLVLSAATMGPLDVAHGTLYAALFGTKELPQILGVVSAVTMACVGASPLLFGIAHERTGSFDAVTTPLLALLAVAAAVLAAARPPRSVRSES